MVNLLKVRLIIILENIFNIFKFKFFIIILKKFVVFVWIFYKSTTILKNNS